MARFDTGIYQPAIQASRARADREVDFFSRLMQQQAQKEQLAKEQAFQKEMAMQKYDADMRQAEAEAKRKQALDPRYLLAKQREGVQLSPLEQSALDIAAAESQRAMFDPATGQLVQTGGFPSMGGEPIVQPSTPPTMQAPEGFGMTEERAAWVQSASNPKERQRRQQMVDEEMFEMRKEERKRAAGMAENKEFAERGFRSLYDTVGDISDTIDKAIEDVSGFTAGAGSLLAGIPSTGAADLRSTLQTIQADAAFGRLQEMREASKTGGALGAVSERELALLQNARVALDQSQTPGQLRENLRKYKDIRNRALDNVADAYAKDYGSMPEWYKKEEEAPESGAVVDYTEYFK